jgi:hypothetical protein
VTARSCGTGDLIPDTVPYSTSSHYCMNCTVLHSVLYRQTQHQLARDCHSSSDVSVSLHDLETSRYVLLQYCTVLQKYISYSGTEYTQYSTVQGLRQHHIIISSHPPGESCRIACRARRCSLQHISSMDNGDSAADLPPNQTRRSCWDAGGKGEWEYHGTVK